MKWGWPRRAALALGLACCVPLAAVLVSGGKSRLLYVSRDKGSRTHLYLHWSGSLTWSRDSVVTGRDVRWGPGWIDNETCVCRAEGGEALKFLSTPGRADGQLAFLWRHDDGVGTTGLAPGPNGPVRFGIRASTLYLTGAVPWVLSVAGGILWSAAVFGPRLKGRGPVCATCGYDLRATPERCPECGAVPV